MKIVSFNISFVYDGDGINGFRHRLGMILDKVYTEEPDVLCLQEVTPQIMRVFKRSLNGYTTIFNGRDSDMGGEGLAICCNDRTTEFQTIDRYWFSPTPEKPGSRYDEGQSKFNRIGQMALLRYNPTNQYFRVFNNHFDFFSEQVGLDSMKQVLERLTKEQKAVALPFFIVGDLNSRPESMGIRYAYEYKDYPLTDLVADVGATCHHYSAKDGVVDRTKIDYIFTDKDTASHKLKSVKWTEHADGIWLSDHYPVAAEIDW